MAFISTSHSVGDIVYRHDARTDSVQRLRIASLTAKTVDATKYVSGQWVVHYICAPAQATELHDFIVATDDELFNSWSSAFPVLDLAIVNCDMPEAVEA